MDYSRSPAAGESPPGPRDVQPGYDSKLRGCDLVCLGINDVVAGGRVRSSSPTRCASCRTTRYTGTCFRKALESPFVEGHGMARLTCPHESRRSLYDASLPSAVIASLTSRTDTIRRQLSWSRSLGSTGRGGYERSAHPERRHADDEFGVKVADYYDQHRPRFNDPVHIPKVPVNRGGYDNSIARG